MLRKIITFTLPLILACSIWSCSEQKGELTEPINANSISLYSGTISPQEPVTITRSFITLGVNRLSLELENPSNYAFLSIYANDTLIVDNLNIPKPGKQSHNILVNIPLSGDVTFKLISKEASLNIEQLTLEPVSDVSFPEFTDISIQAGLDKVSSIKYGGPTVADFDNDGDYDFIVNNHNAESSKLYWNNGNGTVTKHDKNLARWFMHDLHGTAAGDYDNDGDLDLVVTMGGGNGKNPGKANFYQNSDSTLVLSTGDVAIEKGGRGRGAKWSDLDLDGDLDLILINEASLTHSKPQQYFYKNKGDGTFEYTRVAGIEDVEPSRALITDLNNDNIDDIILYSPVSIWLGNGDFTFTDITNQVPHAIAELDDVMALTDVDIDNDGDQDLYLARGKLFEHGEGEAPSVDHDPISKEFSIKPRGYKGVDEFEFIADGNISFHKYNYLTQGTFRGKDYPIYLGKNKATKVLNPGDEFTFNQEMAEGWPEDTSTNGVYFGHIGNGKYKAKLVREDNIFWTFRFSLTGISQVDLGFVAENRNIADILLRNDNGQFVDISNDWNIAKGGNALGVTTGDFNNDSFQDIFVYRWGLIGERISDLMLLNTGKGSFETITMHGANDSGGPGNGDMGQAFDFDLDGDVDLLNGSEDGEWYLFDNQINKASTGNNYALINVGYSPRENIDPIAAEVIITTKEHQYRKRVGSAGAIFSQSLLNIIHFGLGNENQIEKITVRWRNGEVVEFINKQANQLFATDKLDPEAINFANSEMTLRANTSKKIQFKLIPNKVNGDLNWYSSAPDIISVDNKGKITAHGEIGESAIIKAASPANQLTNQIKVTITKWRPVTIERLELPTNLVSLFTNEEYQLIAQGIPDYADNHEFQWTSTDNSIVKVNNNGLLTALSAGEASIIVTSLDNPKISTKTEIKVQDKVTPYISLSQSTDLQNKPLFIGDTLNLTVNYHAGSGNKVINSDEGGVRFWLRHFRSKWIPVRDIVVTDPSALYKESGMANVSIPLAGLIATEELPEGHFYQIRASFAASDGNMYDTTIYPINIKQKVQ